MSKLNVGVIGYGYWGPNLCRNFFEAPGVQLKSIVDLDEKRRNVAADRFPGVVTSASVEAMLADPSIDAVAIATPVSTHYPLAKAALTAGKHVWLEKPITDNVAHGEELVSLAERKGKMLHVDHTFVYTGAVRKIKSLIEEGQLGTLQQFDSVRINLGLFQRDVNVIWDLAPHDFSILNYWLGSCPKKSRPLVQPLSATRCTQLR
jgi:predicted dehydrogenase